MVVLVIYITDRDERLSEIRSRSGSNDREIYEVMVKMFQFQGFVKSNVSDESFGLD